MGRIVAGGGGGSIKSITTANAPLSTRLRYIYLFATILGGGYIIISLSNYSNDLIVDNQVLSGSLWDLQLQESFSERFTIRTPGCSIPALNPYDESVKKFVSYPENIKPCPGANAPLLNNNRTHIWILHENKGYYNVTEDDEFSCCYKAFSRPSAVKDISSPDIDNRVRYSDCVFFNNFIESSDEFARVTCHTGGKEIHEQFFLFAPYKEFKSHGPDKLADEELGYNVILMGIDAVSRQNFYRTMPKTVRYLKSRGAVELTGYNKVGDNTFPNLMPLLLGITESEIKTTCLPYQDATFDNCPFVWEWFKQAGYYTALGEDSSRIGTFNYLKVGFSNTPTDYYIHTFINEAEKHAGKIKDFNSYLCMKNKYFYQVLLDYVESLTTTLKSSKLFGFFWEITMSHDYLNYPMVMDNSYEIFFNKLETTNYLNKTILILLSDHGIRWGEIRSTKQGRIEERLPFVFILTPQSFKDTYSTAYKNLRINSRRLTTPFDLHETLNDLVDLRNIENSKLRNRNKSSYAHRRGISLFLPIPDNRTCNMANIDDHWCTCHKDKKLSLNSVEALQASTHLVNYLNSLLQNKLQCAKLMLDEIIDVTELDVGSPSKDEIGWREFMVTVRTTPGGGIFEATLRQSDLDWILAGTVSRLNLYGNQSRCIHNYQLKLYCYCA